MIRMIPEILKKRRQKRNMICYHRVNITFRVNYFFIPRDEKVEEKVEEIVRANGRGRGNTRLLLSWTSKRAPSVVEQPNAQASGSCNGGDTVTT